ncbi:RNA polymerase sigma factor [Rhodohalobacter mucosus]|uniref:RNA polymerase sigma factor SigW n=1 Tax=Rhodohalobacter mucosus TaxID=2079485 RepID=A0A316TV82_9BACT|nr:RNA polymerase sigma factor [Rhodohalobacter mucosus]PWN06342.1 RNA polymerase sigma factor SigW [Rhodohalobacter mucosus]
MEDVRKEQFRRNVGEIYPRLHRAMRAYLAGSSVDAEDLVQEAFLKAYKNLDSFEGDSGFYTWVYAIARNLAIDEFRKRKYEKMRVSTPSDELSIESSVSDDERDREEILLLRKAVAMLPELLRSVVVMKLIDGLTYPEIAEVTGLNEETVKNRMFRARKELAILMKRMGVHQP